jgi:hypothetical protein
MYRIVSDDIRAKRRVMPECVPNESGTACSVCGWARPSEMPVWPRRNCDGPHVAGPGKFLHAAIKRWFGEEYTLQCGCENRLAQMDAWGPEGCRRNIGTIVDWLWEESQQRDWRFQDGWSADRATSAVRALRRWPRAYELVMRWGIELFIFRTAIWPGERASDAAATSIA